MLERIGISIFFTFLSCGLIFPQVNKDEKEKKERKTSPFDLRNYKPEARDKVLIEFTHCGWVNLPKGVQNDWWSRGANFHLYFDYPFGKSNFSFAWGTGIAAHNISGNAKTVYQIDSLGNETTVFVPRDLPYRKNIIGAKIVEVPAEIRFRTRRARSFKISLGFKAGYTVQNFRKIFDDSGKAKYFDIHNYNPLRYGIVFRVGYEQVYLSAFYSLSPVIRKDKGSPNIFPYTIGIGITPW